MTFLQNQLLKKELNKDFVKKYQCDINQINNYRVWNRKKTCQIKYAPVTLEKPNYILKGFSQQLYDRYVDYYNEKNEL